MAYIQKKNPFRVGKSAFKQTVDKIKTILDNTLKAGKGVSVVSAMLNPTSMGTDDEPDKFRREEQNKVDKANFKKNFKPDISKPWV